MLKTRVEDMEEGGFSWEATSRQPRGELLSSSPGNTLIQLNAVL